MPYPKIKSKEAENVGEFKSSARKKMKIEFYCLKLGEPYISYIEIRKMHIGMLFLRWSKYEYTKP